MMLKWLLGKKSSLQDSKAQVPTAASNNPPSPSSQHITQHIIQYITQSKASNNDDDNDLISDDGKNGLITAIGIVLGFSLTFFGQWSLAENSSITQTTSPPTLPQVVTPPPIQPSFLGLVLPPGWEHKDMPTVILLSLGIIVLGIALYRALLPYHQNVRHFRMTVRIFVIGIVLVFFGFLVGVFYS